MPTNVAAQTPEPAFVNVQVSAAPGSAGTALAITTKTGRIDLLNQSAVPGDIEAKVSAGGDWQLVRAGSGGAVPLNVDMSATTVYVRKANSDIPGSLALTVRTFPATPGSASSTPLGPFADAAALQTASPAGTVGRVASVGATTPYALYDDNGSAWVARGGAGSSAYPSNLFWKGPMAKFAAAKLRGAASPSRVIIMGDSTVAGAGGGTGSAPRMVNARTNAWPVVMARALGWQIGSWFGDGGAVAAGATTLAAYDPRITQGSNWSSGASSFGSQGQQADVVSGDLTFTPESAFDRVTIWYARAASFLSAIVVKIDGATIDIFSAAVAPNALASKTYSVAKGIHTIAVQNNSAATCLITGMETRDSASSAPILIHGGWSGATLSASMNNVGSPWAHRSAMVTYAPDVVALACAINDVSSGTAAITVQPVIAAINIAAKTAGADVVNISAQPPGQHAAQRNRRVRLRGFASRKRVSLRRRIRRSESGLWLRLFDASGWRVCHR